MDKLNKEEIGRLSASGDLFQKAADEGVLWVGFLSPGNTDEELFLCARRLVDGVWQGRGREVILVLPEEISPHTKESIVMPNGHNGNSSCDEVTKICVRCRTKFSIKIGRDQTVQLPEKCPACRGIRR